MSIGMVCNQCGATQGFHLHSDSSNESTVTVQCDECGNVDVWEG